MTQIGRFNMSVEFGEIGGKIAAFRKRWQEIEKQRGLPPYVRSDAVLAQEVSHLLSDATSLLGKVILESYDTPQQQRDQPSPLDWTGTGASSFIDEVEAGTTSSSEWWPLADPDLSEELREGFAFYNRQSLGKGKALALVLMDLTTRIGKVAHLSSNPYHNPHELHDACIESLVPLIFIIAHWCPDIPTVEDDDNRYEDD